MHNYAAEPTRYSVRDGPAQAHRLGAARALALTLAILLTFEGPRPALARMAMAARSCGFRTAKVAADQAGGARLVILTDKGGDDVKERCTLLWFDTHPRLELRVSKAAVG